MPGPGQLGSSIRIMDPTRRKRVSRLFEALDYFWLERLGDSSSLSGFVTGNRGVYSSSIGLGLNGNVYLIWTEKVDIAISNVFMKMWNGKQWSRVPAPKGTDVLIQHYVFPSQSIDR